MADDLSPFSINIEGVQDLIGNPVNKIRRGNGTDEGVVELADDFELDMTDKELLSLRDDWVNKYGPYEGKLKPKVEENLKSYLGIRPRGAWLINNDLPVAGNIQFEAEETFLAAALAKSPTPVVYSSNDEGANKIATDVRTMLQYHADCLALRGRLTVMTRQWSIYYLGVLKHGWDKKTNDITIENRKIENFIFDPTGFVDVYGCFTSYLGERITITARELIDLFPDKKKEITEQVDNKMGSEVTYTEWWTDEYCFSTFKTIVLDKHKNEFFLYDGRKNHFPSPKKPYTFLSVFSLQSQPHDLTGLIEQNIPNQNLVASRTEQIDYNISSSNNGYAFSEDNFNQETGKQAANARKKGNPILIPSGGPMRDSIFPLPAQSLPEAVFVDLQNNKDTLRASWGVQGITSQELNEDQTARGMILNQAHDTTRIGGGIGDRIQQVADNVFNWWVQMYHVFYDEPHYAAVLGVVKSLEYTQLTSAMLIYPLVVSVAPDSMRPRDEITELNLAQTLYDKGAIGPKTLLKMVDFPNSEEAAADGALWSVDKMAYIQVNFPDLVQQIQASQQQQIAMQAQAEGMNEAARQSNTPPEETTEPPQPFGESPTPGNLNQVPLPALPK